MQEIRILCIGKLKSGWITGGCVDYTERLQKSSKFSVVEIPASTAKTAALHISEESERILHWADEYEGDIWVPDERGERRTSAEFAKLIGAARDYGRPLLFVIGGAYGIDDTVRKLAKGILRISDMTLTHEFSRVLLLEQIYRALEILRGSGYHH